MQVLMIMLPGGVGMNVEMPGDVDNKLQLHGEMDRPY